MDPYVIVLARNSRQGMQYAKAIGLQRGRYRVAHSAKNIRNAKRADVHLLDTFWKRPDRHALLGALRYTKGEWFSVSWPLVSSNGDIPQMSSYGDIPERTLEAAYRYNRLLDTPALDAVAEQTKRAELHAALVDKVLGDERPNWDEPEDPSPEDALDDLAQVSTVLSNVDAALAEGSPEPGSAADVLEKPKRRRRRHAECGELHFPEEPCPTPAPVPAPQTAESFFGGS